MEVKEGHDPVRVGCNLEVKARMTMTAPVKAMVEKRKASLAAPLRILSLKTKLVPRLPTM